MKKVLISVFTLLSTISYSQKLGALGIGQTNNTKYHTVPEQIGLEGNINYFEEFQPGIVFYKDSTQIDVPLLNYNLLMKKVTLKLNDGEFFLPNENRIDSFKIADKTFVSNSKISSKRAFCEVLYYSKNLELIKQSNAQIVTGKQGTGMTPTTPDRVKISSSYYLLKDDNQYKLELSKSEIYEVLGDEERLDKFRKEQKLKLKKEEDFIRLLTYYDQTILSKKM